MYKPKRGKSIDENSLMQRGKQFHMVLLPEDLEKLFEIAKKKGVSASEMVRIFIKEYK
jgi:hypothetical protein